MKKFLTLFVAILFVTEAANATGFYVGADLFHAQAQNTLSDKYRSSGASTGDKKSDDSLGYGVNAGFRLDVLSLLAFGEVFYDQIGTSANGFSSTTNGSSGTSSLEINHRYGAKANVGFAILPRVTPFLGFGMANVSYHNESSSGSSTGSKNETTPIYSAGLIVDLIAGISARASYDYQSFSTKYVNGSSVRTHLGTAKLGVMYSF